MGINTEEFVALINSAHENMTIVDAFAKCESEVRGHDKIMASVSGGWDSDIMLDMIVRCGGKEKTTFVFFNTGLEYAATKNHIKDLEQKYGVSIETVPPVKPIPLCVREHGVPFWSKRASEMIMRLQKHDFQWEDGTLDELLEKYPKCRSALRWWCNDYTKDNGKQSALNISWVPWLKEYMLANPPDFKISAKCCHYAKKEPAKKYRKQNACDMEMTGVRKAEGGTRATGIHTCFSQSPDGTDAYRPLFWFSDDDKEEYTQRYDVSRSDCYTVWGLPRTGCACCPFAKDFEKELELVKTYEPNFYKAANNIFGKAYEYTRNFEKFREEKRRQNNGEKETGQYTQAILPL